MSSRRKALRAVQRVLTDDLLSQKFKRPAGSHRLTGHCYVAAEALYHILDGKKSGWTPVCLSSKDAPEFGPHWWLQHPEEGLLDPTEEQFDGAIPYHLGRRKGFLTLRPSKRAAEVIKRVSATQGYTLAQRR